MILIQDNKMVSPYEAQILKIIKISLAVSLGCKEESSYIRARIEPRHSTPIVTSAFANVRK